MALNALMDEYVKTVLSKYCEKRVPMEVRNKLRLSFKIRGNSVTLLEERTAFRRPDDWIEVPIAQFRYNPKENLWMLYCRDRNRKWHIYEYCKPHSDIQALLKSLEDDTIGIFWG